MAKFIKVRESHRGSDKFTYINVDHIRCVEDVSKTPMPNNDFLNIPNAMSAIHMGHRMTVYSLDTMDRIMDMINMIIDI